MENYEITTANGQYSKVFIDKCLRELRMALALDYAQRMSACQQLALHILQGEFECAGDG